jgi:hypothetical protein
MARDGDINLNYTLTAEMLANCFTKPLLKLTVTLWVAIGKIGIGVRNSL